MRARPLLIKRDRESSSRALRLRQTLLNAPLLHKQMSVPVMDDGVAGIQLDSTLKFQLRSFPVPIVVVKHMPHGRVGLGECIIEFQGARSCCLSLGHGIARRHDLRTAQQTEKSVVIRRPGVGEAIVRIRLNRFLKIGARLLQAVGSPLIPVIPTEPALTRSTVRSPWVSTCSRPFPIPSPEYWIGKLATLKSQTHAFGGSA